MLIDKLKNGLNRRLIPTPDAWGIGAICLIAVFSGFDFFSTSFSWGVFQERDFSRAADFILGQGLSHLGPELNAGGFLPGPGLTLLLAPLVFLFKSPRAIHIFIQLSFIFSLILTFILTKHYFNRPIAYISVLLLISSDFFISLSYTGLHQSFIIFFLLFILLTAHLYHQTKKRRYALATGCLIGFGLQVHLNIFIYSIGSLLFLFTIKRKIPWKFGAILFLGLISTLVYYFYHDYLLRFENTKHIFASLPSYLSEGRESPFDAWFLYSEWVFYKPIQWLSLFMSAAGLIYAADKHTDDRMKKFLLPMAYCVFLILIPGLMGISIERYYQIAHPAFEVLFASSIYFLYTLLNPFFIAQIFLTLGLMVLCSHNISRLDKKPGFETALAWRNYSHFKSLTDALLNTLRLTPFEYETKFCMIQTPSPLSYLNYTPPSGSHYKLLYKEHAPHGKQNTSWLNETHNSGVLLFLNGYFKNDCFNLKNVSPGKIIHIPPFVAFLYNTPYIYRRPTQTHELLNDEIRLNNWRGAPLIVNKSSAALHIELLSHVAHVNYRFNYLFVLKLQQDSPHLISGYAEIIGTDLRILMWRRRIPFGIYNPCIELRFKDASVDSFELLKDNFFTKDYKMYYDPAFVNFGNTGKNLRLGPHYIETPYGMSITLKGKSLSDIRSVSFLHHGYAFSRARPTNQKEKIILADVKIP